jgi:hypothetical protein
MANRKVEEQIEQLTLLCDAPAGEAVAGLRKALANRVNLVIAKAAKIAAERQMQDVIPDLIAAFDRLFENAAARDPQCWGKNAIAKALTELDYRGSEPYLWGVRHIQTEPVWGGQEDTAQTLRGICLLGLVTCHDIQRVQVLRCLVEALTEPAQTVRAEAVRAIAEMGGDEASLVLRLKARVGDEELEVTGLVLDALLKLEQDAALSFVAGFMQTGGPDVKIEAALALGTSRLAAAVDLLEETWANTRDSGLREAVLRALSATRQPRAFEFLTGLLKTGRAADAAIAIEALALHRESPEIRRAVEEAVRGSASLEEKFRQLFEA